MFQIHAERKVITIHYLETELTRLQLTYNALKSKGQKITALYYKGRIDQVKALINFIQIRKES
jgi:hypothetical protein